MDWSRHGRVDSFVFVRVRWPSFEEAEEIGASACEYTLDMLSDLKASGRLTLPSGLALGDDMVRAYSESRLPGLGTERVCHYTMGVRSDTDSMGAAGGSARATLYSTLKVLQDESTDETLTVPAGTDPVAWAAGACRDRHLPVSAVPYGGLLAGDAVYEPDTTILAVVNDLLGRAGYGSAGVDPWGRVSMAPYVDPSGRPVAATFDESCSQVLMSPSVKRTFKRSDVCNVVTCVGEDADGNPLRAQARNDSPSSRWSTVSRCRTLTRYVRVDGVTDGPALESKARSMLREETMAADTLEIEHWWHPIAPGDAVMVDLPSQGVRGRYSVTSKRVALKPGMRTKTCARAFVDLEGTEW